MVFESTLYLCQINMALKRSIEKLHENGIYVQILSYTFVKNFATMLYIYFLKTQQYLHKMSNLSK